MKEKNQTTLVKVEGGKSLQEQPTATTEAANETTTAQEQKTESLEELKSQVEALKGKLLRIPQNLDDRIKYFNEKKELIRRLTVLNGNAEALEGHTQKLHEIAQTNDFENEDYILSVEGGTGGYRKASIFTLKNPVIISEVITYMLNRIDVKRLEIAAQIEA